MTMTAKSIFTDDIYEDERTMRSPKEIDSLISSGIKLILNDSYKSALTNNGSNTPESKSRYAEFSIYKDNVGEDGKFRIRTFIDNEHYTNLRVQVDIVQYHEEGAYIPWKVIENFDVTRILHSEIKKNKNAIKWYLDENTESKKKMDKFIEKITPIIIADACSKFKKVLLIS